MGVSTSPKAIQVGRTNVRTVIGWGVTIVIPLLVYYIFSKSLALEPATDIFISVALLAVCMWIFDLAPPFVPALFIILVTVLFDVTPKNVALSGFSSDAFFILLGIFVFAAQVASSGLLKRVTLLLINWLPKSNLSQSLIIFASGSFLSTILPSPLGRAALLNPLVFDLIDNAPKTETEAEPEKAMFTPLIMSALQGTTLLSTIFLTGNPLNLVMLGFFNAQTQYRFQWIYWLQATLVVGVILVAGYLAILAWLVRKSNLQPMSKTEANNLLMELGPMSEKEWGAVIGIVVFSVGIMTERYHQIEPVWLAFGIALVLYLYGALTVKDLRSNIDWPTLMFVAAIVSWGPIMSYLRLDTLISGQVSGLGFDTLLLKNLPLGLGLLAALIILIRFMIPGGPTFIILISALIPLASSTGISPWVLGFVALTISEGFILPYQHGVSSQMVEELKTHGLEDTYSPRDIMISNVLIMAFRLIAILAAIAYWRVIAIL